MCLGYRIYFCLISNIISFTMLCRKPQSPASLQLRPSTLKKCIVSFLTLRVQQLKWLLPANRWAMVLHRIEWTRIARRAWWIAFQVLIRACGSQQRFCNGLASCPSLLSISPHRCSTGDKSSTLAGQGKAGILCWFRWAVTTRATWGQVLKCQKHHHASWTTLLNSPFCQKQHCASFEHIFA